MKVLKNYIYNISYQILALVLPLITGPYVSRALGPHGVGINTYTYTIANWFVLLGSIGVAFYGNRQIAYVRGDNKELTINFWEIFIMKLVTICLSLVVYVLYIIFIGRYKEYQLLQSIYVIAAGLDISWFFMGIEDFKRTVIRNTFVKVGSLILILIFVNTKADLLIYMVILALATLIGNLTLWPFMKNLLVKVSINELHPFRHFNGAITLFLPLAAIQIYANLNKIMLGVFDSTTASGFYDKSDAIVKMALTLGTSLVTVLVPRASQFFASGNEEGVKNILYKTFNFITFISLPLSFGLGGISLKFGVFFYGKGFENVGGVMLIESVLIVVISWASVIGNQYLVPTNQTSPYTRSVFLGAIVNIILNVPLIMVLGVYGAMLSTVISEISVTYYQIHSIRKQIDYKMLFIDLKKCLFASIIMFIVVFTINSMLSLNIMTLSFEVIVGAIIYVGLISVLKPTILLDINRLFFKK